MKTPNEIARELVLLIANCNEESLTKDVGCRHYVDLITEAITDRDTEWAARKHHQIKAEPSDEEIDAYIGAVPQVEGSRTRAKMLEAIAWFRSQIKPITASQFLPSDDSIDEFINGMQAKYLPSFADKKQIELIKAAAHLTSAWICNHVTARLGRLSGDSASASAPPSVSEGE